MLNNKQPDIFNYNCVKLLQKMDSDNYKTISKNSCGIFKEKGSRFLSFAFPLDSADAVKPLIDKIRKEHHEARHHCFAYMLGKERNIWRANDDGEPSGTGGKPILGQINSAGLTNILIVVSRYFGGTLLGVSGLINAYRSAASDAIINSEIITCSVQDFFELRFPYISMNDIMKVLKDEDIEPYEQTFDLECIFKISFSQSTKERILIRLDRIIGLTYTYLFTR